MERTNLTLLLAKPLEEIKQRSRITEHLIDKNKYELYLTTLWMNIVLEMEDIGLAQADLEPALEIINKSAQDVLGAQEPVIEAFRHLTTKEGEQLMEKENVSTRHKQMLLYLASIILDPEGHKRWMETVTQ